MNPIKITTLNTEQAAAVFPQLVELLRDAIENGASVGFVLPLAEGELETYWNNVLPDIDAGKKILLIAQTEGGQVVGSVQLALESRRNGIHRAEIQKLLVHTDARRQGIATQLMSAVETAARDQQRTLLVLDTRQGSDAEILYAKIGYLRLGTIPNYAIDPDGVFVAGSTIFYRLLD